MLTCAVRHLVVSSHFGVAADPFVRQLCTSLSARLALSFSHSFFVHSVANPCRSSWSSWARTTTRWPKTDLPFHLKSTRTAEVFAHLLLVAPFIVVHTAAQLMPNSSFLLVSSFVHFYARRTTKTPVPSVSGADTMSLSSLISSPEPTSTSPHHAKYYDPIMDYSTALLWSFCYSEGKTVAKACELLPGMATSSSSSSRRR